MAAPFGAFWLPGSPEKSVKGRLYTTADGATRVDLAEPLTSGMKIVSQNPITNETVMEPEDDPMNLLVHGVVDGRPQAITLLDCWSPSRSEVWTSAGIFQTQTIQAGRVVRGAHVTSETTYTGVRIRAADIDSWAHVPGLLQTDDEDAWAGFRMKSANISTVKTTGGAVLGLAEQLGATRRFSTEGKVTRTAWIQIEQIGESTARTIDANYVTPVIGYLSFALGVSTPLTAVQLQHGEDWVATAHGGMTPDAPDKVDRHNVLLPLTVAGLDTLSRFLDAYKNVGPAIPITVDALSNRRNVTLDTQVAELTTVAEGLHRALFPDEVRMPEEDVTRLRQLVREAVKDEERRYRDIVNGSLNHLKDPNYKTRLKRLATEADRAMPGVCGNHEQWVKRVDAARNSFAHRKDGFIAEDLIDEMYVISQSLKWVFLANILLAAGLSPDILKARIQQHQRYQFFMADAPNSLPVVYAKE